jgi:hypothetical protein
VFPDTIAAPDYDAAFACGTGQGIGFSRSR